MFSVEENSAFFLAGAAAARRRERPGAQAPGLRPLWNALHFPVRRCPAGCAGAEEEPGVAVLWRGSIFRRRDLPRGRRLWQNHSQQDLQEDQHGPIDPSRRSGRRRGTVGGHSRHDGATESRRRRDPMRRPWWAPSLRRSTRPSTARRTYQASATGIWRRAVPESTAGPGGYGYLPLLATRAPAAIGRAAPTATGAATAAGAVVLTRCFVSRRP